VRELVEDGLGQLFGKVFAFNSIDHGADVVEDFVIADPERIVGGKRTVYTKLSQSPMDLRVSSTIRRNTHAETQATVEGGMNCRRGGFESRKIYRTSAKSRRLFRDTVMMVEMIAGCWKRPRRSYAY